MSTDLSFKILNDSLAWDDFVRRSPQGSVFSLSGFIEAYRLDHDFCVIEREQEIVAALVVFKDQTGKALTAPFPFGQYQQTILLSPSEAATPLHSSIRKNMEAVDFLLSQAWERYGQISLFLHHSFPDLRPVSWFHYHEPQKGLFDTKVYYTGIIDLGPYQSFDAYLGGVRKSRRQEYQGASRKGLLVSQENNVATLIDLYGETLTRQDIKLEKSYFDLLERIFEFAVRSGCGEMLVSRDSSGRPIASTLFLRDRTTAYYLIAANHPDSRNLGAGSQLLLENIRRAFERGIRKIDLVGINSPNRGDFKISFNADPKPYFICNCRPPG